MNAEQQRKTRGYLQEAVSVLTAMSETAQADGLPELAANFAETAQAFRQERFRLERESATRQRSEETDDSQNAFPGGRWATRAKKLEGAR